LTTQQNSVAPTHIKFFHSFEFSDTKIVGLAPIESLRLIAADVFKHPVVGRTVLDIGAWDGFYSFEAERLGALRVHATDHFCWSGKGWGTKAGFDYVSKVIGSRIESTDIDVFDLDPNRLGTYDTVLFLGVLYHLTDPFGGLKKASEMCNDHLVVETHTDMNDIIEPVMRFHLGSSLNGDPTNFWSPNENCLLDMLRELNFKRFETSRRPAESKEGRMVVHAWKQ
jgi:tRNA (mo5U34)-methyltransferase